MMMIMEGLPREVARQTRIYLTISASLCIYIYIRICMYVGEGAVNEFNLLPDVVLR